MTDNNQLTLKQEIAEIEKIANASDPTCKNDFQRGFCAGERAGSKKVMKIISRLSDVKDMLMSNSLVAEHYLEHGDLESAKTTLYHAIEKSKQLLGE
jgi:hypothetical protein